MRHARPPGLAVILVWGVLGLLAYFAGAHLPWEAGLQWILMTAQGPGARVFAVAVLIIAAVVLAFGDGNGAVRRLPHIAFSLCVAFARWLIGDAFGSFGRSEHRRGDSHANDSVASKPGSCHLELNAADSPGFLLASWGSSGEPAVTTLDERVPIDRLNFRYDITGGEPSWRPLRAFDDGEKVYIQFPEGVPREGMRLFFAASGSAAYEPAEYRTQGSYAIANRLFDSAELRSGNKRDPVVRIRRRRPVALDTE